MFVPPHFRQEDLGAMHAFIEQRSFCILVTIRNGEPIATHLPLLLDRSHGKYGQLKGHIARKNPQWEHFQGSEALVLFHGPHAYVSPAWYESNHVVPTWNYVAVHAYCSMEVLEDASSIRSIVEESVQHYESSREERWELPRSSAVIDGMLSHIVGLRLTIQRLEGKWKLSQNHPMERRLKVIDALQGGDEAAQEIASRMRREIESEDASRDISTSDPK
jgi:transcriptional regulator